jgi:hypothetical protein
VLQDCVGTFVDAGSSASLETFATHLRSSGIWCGRDSIGHGLVDPDHLPHSGVTPFVLFIDAPGISAAVCGWALRQAVARSRPSLPGQKRRCSGRGHRHAGVGVIRTPIFNPLCPEHWGILGLAFLALIGGFLAVWWLVALTGAVVGWGLNR